MSKPYKKQAYKGAKPVADFVSKLLNPVIEQRAGMTLDLLTVWDDIIGPEHAKHTRAEKLLWPRQMSDDDPFEPATLIVACEQGQALYIQHQSADIIARVNNYFGFAAVGRIKVVQKAMTQLLSKHEMRRQKNQEKLTSQQQEYLQTLLHDIQDPKLKIALERMGKGILKKT